MATEIFCSVKAGVNICEICSQEAYFSTLIPQRPHKALRSMELLYCGHGICASCMEEMVRRGPFKCPYCRIGGTQIVNFEHAVALSLQSRGLLHTNDIIPSRTKVINTFSEFIEAKEETYHMIINSNNRFMVLYEQIKRNKQKSLQNAKKLALKHKQFEMKEEKKRARERSRDDAVCPLCHKNKFTSMKQLEQHMNAKHSKPSKQAKLSKR